MATPPLPLPNNPSLTRLLDFKRPFPRPLFSCERGTPGVPSKPDFGLLGWRPGFPSKPDFGLLGRPTLSYKCPRIS